MDGPSQEEVLEYFTSLSQVTALTSKALAAQEKVISIATGSGTPFDSPTTSTSNSSSAANDNIGVVNAIGGLQTSTSGQLATLNGSNAATAAALLRIEQLIAAQGKSVVGLNF